MTGIKKKIFYKDLKTQMILKGNLFKIILILALPIALTNIVFSLLPSKIDMLTATAGSKKSLSITDSLPIFHSIKQIFFYFGVSLAMASTVLIGREYGKGEYQKAYLFMKITLLTVFCLSLVLSILGIFCRSFIIERIIHSSDQNEIKEVSYYYLCLMFIGIVMSISNVFLGLLRINGQIKVIYFSNLIFLLFKILINLIFIRYQYSDMVYLGLSTLISFILSNLFLLFFVWNIFKKFKLMSRANLTFIEKTNYKFFYFKNILRIFYPIFIGKFIYEFGKLIIFLIINNPTFYQKGSLTNSELADFVVGFGLQFGFALEEGQLLIISENLGNKNISRALKTIYNSLIINFFFGIFYTFLIFIFGENLLHFINKIIGNDKYVISNSFQFYFFIISACISGFFTVILQGILLKSLVAFKKPRLDMYCNIFRIIIRIPLILLLRYTFITKFFGFNWNNPENGWKGYCFANLFSNFILLFFVLYFFINFIKSIKRKKIFQDFYVQSNVKK